MTSYTTNFHYRNEKDAPRQVGWLLSADSVSDAMGKGWEKFEAWQGTCKYVVTQHLTKELPTK